MDDWVVKESNVSQLVLPVGAHDHAKGSWEAIVTLLEYGDLECAHCAETFRVVKEVTRWLRGELYYVFRHFPAANEYEPTQQKRRKPPARKGALGDA